MAIWPKQIRRHWLKLRTAKLAKGDTGVVLLEFVLLIPLVLIWVFGILEIGDVLRVKQKLADVAGQLAATAFYVCEDAAEGSELSDCITGSEVHDLPSNFQQALAEALPDYATKASVLLNVYEQPSLSGAQVYRLNGLNYGLTGRSSKFSATSAGVKEIAQQIRRSYTVEIYYQRSVFGAWTGLLGRVFPEVLYEAALR